MIMDTGRAWAEAVRNRWRDDPYGLVMATRLVTAGSYAALAAAALLFFIAGAGSLLALLAAVVLAGLGAIGLVGSIFLRLPPWVAWWTPSRPLAHAEGAGVPRTEPEARQTVEKAA